MSVVAQFKSCILDYFFGQTLKCQTIVIVRWNLIIYLSARFFFAHFNLITRVCFLSRINNEKQHGSFQTHGAKSFQPSVAKLFISFRIKTVHF